MNDDLVAWLRAQLDEDEQVAKAATAAHDAYTTSARHLAQKSLDEDDTPVDVARDIRAVVAHIARHDPARVLAEVAAKRRIIDRTLQWMAMRDGEWGCCHDASSIGAGLCPEENPSEDRILRLLASVYAGRPGWREEWAADEEVQRG